MSLNYQDIQAILKVLDGAAYDELQLDNDDFSLYLKRNDKGDWNQDLKEVSSPNTLSKKSAQLASLSEEKTTLIKEPEPIESGLIDIRAPMVGTFYRSPQPGADSFVDIGSSVDESTIIAIIEVMKLMSSIPAKVNGEIREILVDDAELVEKGQLIMRVKPASP